MSWLAIKSFIPARIGASLALLIVTFQPNFGIVKYGPSPVIPAFFLFVLGIWYTWKERATLFAEPAQRRWQIVFLLLFLPVVISAPGSFNPRASFSVAFVLFLYFFAGVALLRALRDDSERTWLIKWVSLILLFWAVDGFLQLLLGSDLFGIALPANGRVLGPFSENLHLSVLMAFLMPLLFAWLWSHSLLLALAAFVSCGAIALLSGSRTALFSLAIVAIGIFLRIPGGRIKVYIIIAIATVGFVATALSPVLQERFARFDALYAPTFETIDFLLSYRLTIWDNALNMIADRPVNGVGAGAFQEAYAQYSTRPDDYFLQGVTRVYHAHQLYVGVAAETGLTGLAALLAIVTYCIYWYRRATPAQRSKAWPFALGLGVYAFPINSQPVLYTQWLFPVLLLLLAGMLAALDESERAK